MMLADAAGRTRRVLRLALSASALALLFAAPVRAETLIEAWVRAYETNPTIDAERAALRAADERVALALSGWRPIFQGRGSMGAASQDSNRRINMADDRLYPAQIALTLQQPLYRGGRTVAATDRAENDVQGQRARLRAIEQQVFLEVGATYMSVLRDQAVVELNEGNVGVLERQLAATRDRFSVGEVTRTDVAQAEAAHARARAELVSATGNLEISRASYERLLGAMPGQLEPPPEIPGLPLAKAPAIEAARIDNPAVLAADFAERSARANVRQVEGEMLPSVNLVASVSRDWDSQVRDGRVDQARAIVEVTVPLYQAGGVAARVREAKQLAGQQRIRIEEARRGAVEAATQAWESLETARARIVSLTAQIAAAEVALDGTQQEALVGSRTVLDVLEAEQALLDARVDLVSSERDLAIATFQLASAVGRLTADGLNLAVDYYDPDHHYRSTRDRWWGTDPSPSSAAP